MNRTVPPRARSEGLGATRKAAGQAAVRDVMAEVAETLFVRHGFEAVTLDQVAEACDVSVRTVLRYFPNKEQLALSRSYSRLDAFRAALSVHSGDTLSYWRKHVMSEMLHIAGDQGEALRAHSKMVSASPSLRAHSTVISRQYEAMLAQALAEEAGDSGFGPRLLANVLVGGHLAAVEHWLASGDPFDPEMFLRVIEFASNTVPDYFPPAPRPSRAPASAPRRRRAAAP